MSTSTPEKFIMPQCLWRIKDVSRFLNISEGTIRYWIHIKCIRFRKIGRLVRFLPQEIIEDFNNQTLGKMKYQVGKIRSK